MAFKLRRVVTGHDRNGKAVVTFDSVPENIGPMRPGVTGCVAWTTDRMPADLGGDEDMGLRPVRTAHAGGTVFRIVEYRPGAAPRNHRTASIDYGVVISGEIDMELDDNVTVHLRAGDVLVQRGTIHNWINRGNVPCIIAFVLIDATPPAFGGKQLVPTG